MKKLIVILVILLSLTACTSKESSRPIHTEDEGWYSSSADQVIWFSPDNTFRYVRDPSFSGSVGYGYLIMDNVIGAYSFNRYLRSEKSIPYFYLECMHIEIIDKETLKLDDTVYFFIPIPD